MPDLAASRPLREEPVYFRRWELVTTARLYVEAMAELERRELPLVHPVTGEPNIPEEYLRQLRNL